MVDQVAQNTARLGDMVQQQLAVSIPMVQAMPEHLLVRRRESGSSARE